MNNIKEIKEQYPKGTPVVLKNMNEEPQMPYGLKGKVEFVDDAGQIHVNWENGSSLALNIKEDTFAIIKPVEKISVLLVKPNEYPQLVEIENSLESMQNIVGGCIEEYVPFDDEIAIICNEEGKMNGLPLNRAIYSEDKEMIDIIAGTFFICYAPFDSEQFLSLPENLAKKYAERFMYPEKFYKQINGKIIAQQFKPTTQNNSKKDTLICIIGESGSGKTTIANYLWKKYGLKSVQSYTDRPIRYTNETGHTFISKEKMSYILQNDKIVSQTVFCNNRYCVTEQMLNESDVFVVDMVGYKELKDCYHSQSIVSFYLETTPDVRKSRMLQRGDAEEEIKKRLIHDRKAFANAENIVDFVIDNNDRTVEEVCEQIIKCIR